MSKRTAASPLTAATDTCGYLTHAKPGYDVQVSLAGMKCTWLIHHSPQGETMATAPVIPQIHVRLLSPPQEGDSSALQMKSLFIK